MQRPTLLASDYKTTYTYAHAEKLLQIEKEPQSGQWELRELYDGFNHKPLALVASAQQAYDKMLQIGK